MEKGGLNAARLVARIRVGIYVRANRLNSGIILTNANDVPVRCDKQEV